MSTIWNSSEWRRTAQESLGVGLDSFDFVTLVLMPIVSPDAAILFDLHARDSSTQQHFATFSPQALMGNESHDDREPLILGKPF